MARRNRREAAEVIQEGPREEEIVESDTEEEEILRSEKPHLCVFVFQLLELEVDLQQQRFLPLSILGCG